MTADRKTSWPQPEQHWSDTFRFARQLRRGDEYAFLQLTPGQMRNYVLEITSKGLHGLTGQNLLVELPKANHELTVRLADTFSSLLEEIAGRKIATDHIEDTDIHRAGWLARFTTALPKEVAKPRVRPAVVSLTKDWQSTFVRGGQTEVAIINLMIARLHVMEPTEDAAYWKEIWENKEYPMLHIIASRGLLDSDPDEYVRQLPEALRRDDLETNGNLTMVFPKPEDVDSILERVRKPALLDGVPYDEAVHGDLSARVSSLFKGEPIWAKPLSDAANNYGTAAEAFLNLLPGQLRRYILDLLIGGEYKLFELVPEKLKINPTKLLNRILHLSIGESTELDRRTLTAVGSILHGFSGILANPTITHANLTADENRAACRLALLTTQLPRDLALKDSLLKSSLIALTNNWQQAYELAMRAFDKNTFPNDTNPDIHYPVDDFRTMGDRLKKNLWTEKNAETTPVYFDTETMLWLARLRLTEAGEHSEVWRSLWEDEDPRNIDRWTAGFLGIAYNSPGEAVDLLPQVIERTKRRKTYHPDHRFRPSYVLENLLLLVSNNPSDHSNELLVKINDAIEETK